MEKTETVLARFERLPGIAVEDMVGLWKGTGIPSGHPLDGVLENLGWFGKRFGPDMRADALLFRTDEKRLLPIEPALIPLRLALRLGALGRTGMVASLFAYARRFLRAKGTSAALQTASFGGVMSAAMAYDRQPILDHFRRIDENTVMGAMTIEGDSRLYFFQLTRLTPQEPPVAGG